MPSRSSEPTATATDLASFVLRVPLGVLLVWGGVVRLMQGASDPDWAMPVTSILTEDATRMVLIGLPYAELVAGLLLGAGFLGRLGAFVAIATLVTLCLVYGWSAPEAPFTPRVVYLAVSTAVMLLGSGALSADFLLFGASRDRR